MDAHTLYRWLGGADDIFEAFEGRGDAYKICKRWVDERFSSNNFVVTKEDEEFLRRNFMDSFTQTVEIIISRDREITEEEEKKEVKILLIKNMKSIIQNLSDNSEKLSFAFAPYLVSWNIQRFKEYFKRKNREPWFRTLGSSGGQEAVLVYYFGKLDEVFNDELIQIVRNFREKNLFESEIEEDKVKDIFDSLEGKLRNLGINEKEPVGTVKILHILAPFHFPLIDNPIARGLAISGICNCFKLEKIKCNKRNRNGKYVCNFCKSNIVSSASITIYNGQANIDFNSYIHYMHWIKKKFSPFKKKIDILEQETSKPFLKLLDQAFYIRYSIDIARRLES